MNLHRLLLRREATANPVRVGVIGAGKFASMFLAQARRTPGLQVLGVCDLDLQRARRSLLNTGWPREQFSAPDFGQALVDGRTCLTEDASALITAPGLDVVVEATGAPGAGIRHVLASIDAGRHIVMVTVEADALAGPLLAARAQAAGVIYSLAYGDQPALIAEQVDWARACGFDVVCAGKGTKYLPEYHASTPDTVWSYYGLSAEQARLGGMNPKMFNSFLDGTKSAIEMTAVANATGLLPAIEGLRFPPCEPARLPQMLKPANAGGILDHAGMVEVVSSVARDGSELGSDLRWGVYVVFEAPSDYVARCFSEYGFIRDRSGRYAAMYRPTHLIGLELGISVASTALRGEPTGCARAFHGDTVAIAKRNLAPGETLDGEGGYTVWGRLMPAASSLREGALPIGLASAVTLTKPVARGELVHWNDVDCDPNHETVRVRRAMEQEFNHSLDATERRPAASTGD